MCRLFSAGRHPNDRQGKDMQTQGFTLVELLVVIVILAVLAAILLPSYGGAGKSVNQRAAQIHAQTVKMALDTAIAANPNLSTSTLGTVNCTNAQDVGATGVTAPNGGNGWQNAPAGTSCAATPLTPRTYRVSVTISETNQTVVAP